RGRSRHRARHGKIEGPPRRDPRERRLRRRRPRRAIPREFLIPVSAGFRFRGRMNDANWSLSNAGGASSSGTVTGVRRSPRQALLATKEFALVNCLESWVGHAAGRASLVTQRDAPGV